MPLKMVYQYLKPYFFLMILITAIILGGLTGYWLGPKASGLKPLGDIFLNLMFTVVIPLVFFSIASAIASMGELQRLWQVISRMFLTFIFTGTIAAVIMIIAVLIFPPAQGVFIKLAPTQVMHHVGLGDQLVGIFTVADFFKLFSRENILALIFFATLVGLAASMLGEKAKIIADFLQAGTAVSMKTVSFIMYYAPIGFFAYFAVLVAELGPKLFTDYFRAMAIYYPVAIFYFLVVITFYAYLAGKTPAVKLFWKNISIPSLTALATCSSAASIPANLQAAKQMKVPAEIYETTIPLGSILHKDGSVLGGVVKIAFLFGIFHLSFSGPFVLLSVLLVALLVGTVMGAIPSGGMVAEILILSLYGLPPEALIIIAAITILIDPLATLLNVTSNTACSMLTARWVEGKNWLTKT